MKKIYFIPLLIWSFVAHAQERLQNILLLGESDAKKILTAFAEPAATIGGFTQAEGWYHSARPLKPGNFNLQFIGMVSVVPDDKLNFDIRSLNLQNGRIPSGESGMSSTVIGATGGGGRLIVNRSPGTGGRPDTIRLLDGSGLPIVPMFTPQINIGLIRNTEISFRGMYIPIATTEKDIILTTFGVGIKHDIKQWIPSIALSNFSLSVIANYNVVKSDYGLSIDNLPINPNDQKWKFHNTTSSVGLIASKRLPLLTFMGGVRYDQIKTTMDLVGTYLVGDTPTAIPKKDPVSQDFRDSRVGLVLGTKLKLGWLSLHITGLVSKYSSFSVGLGFGKNE
jgi:hypothetical protein